MMAALKMTLAHKRKLSEDDDYDEDDEDNADESDEEVSTRSLWRINH